MPQFQLSPHTMPKKSGKKKDNDAKGDSDVDIISKIEIIYKDTKSITRPEQDLSWVRYIR